MARSSIKTRGAVLLNDSSTTAESYITTSLGRMFANVLTGQDIDAFQKNLFFLLFPGTPLDVLDNYETRTLKNEAILASAIVTIRDTVTQGNNTCAEFIGSFESTRIHTLGEVTLALAINSASYPTLFAVTQFDLSIFSQLSSGKRVDVQWQLGLVNQAYKENSDVS